MPALLDKAWPMIDYHWPCPASRGGIGLTPWHFTTETLPLEERRRAWEDALNQLCLPIGSFPADEALRASISCIVSPLGIEFARIHSSAHEISGVYPNQPSSMWLVLLLEGEAEFFDGRQHYRVRPGDLTYGPSGVPATLRFERSTSQLFIKVPQLALKERLIRPLSLQVGFLSGQSGITRVLSGMLASLADGLDDITANQLQPVELSLTEFLVTCLAEAGSLAASLSAPDTAARLRTAQLHRICQTIEALLGNPQLSPRRVADEHGVSLRYLQKLFSVSARTFSGYVRLRRLERCRADLASPLYAELSITEICYRWGFNASAHFSRAFRKQYGQSPREYRLAARVDVTREIR